ncbi:MAG: DUF3035 domain-containing protein [Rhodospirillales bacterium]|nr:DUF3035 domain-containing protein [Rhodospirillales bacterium]
MLGRLFVAVSLVLALAACEGVKKQLGLTKQPPDEFRVQARAPLSMPPDFSLRPPQPGTPRPQEGTVQEQARQVVLGDTGKIMGFAKNGSDPAETRSPGELALLSAAGTEKADPDIRQIVDWETAQINVQNEDFLEAVIFWREPEPPGVVVDPEEEAKRLRENAALGKPVVAGETPTIERRKKALFEGIF